MERGRHDLQGAGARDGQVAVRLGEDRMAAYLTVTAPDPGGRPVTVEEALTRLREAGVVFGVDRGAVERAVLTAPHPVPGLVPEAVLVARGRPPVPGQDAQIEYHGAVAQTGGRPQVRADGSVDLFDLGLVRNVARGTLLATRVPPVPGQSGMTVLGTEVAPRPCRDHLLRAGEGVVVSEDGLTAKAEIDGHVSVAGGRISVTAVYPVDGDVGPGTGNIRFVGSVVVKGNICPGFWVKAEGDVEVFGGIDSGTVEAGGNVSVRYGIQGAGRGRVVAAGAVRARFIENAEVKAGGDVWVADGILHSRVEAGARVEVLGRRGAIVGGRVAARDAVSARFLGAAMGTPTEIAVGMAPNVRDEMEEIRRQVLELEESLRRTQQAVQLLKDQERRGGLVPEKRGMLLKLVRGQYHLSARRDELVQRREELERLLGDARSAWVRALDMCYPGVRVVVGQAPYVVTDLLHRTHFALNDKQEVQIGPI